MMTAKFVKFSTSCSMGGKDPLAQVLINADNVIAAYPQTAGTTILHMIDGDRIEVFPTFDVVMAKLNMGSRAT